MADLGWPELSIIALAVVLLFGWRRLPDMARSLGRSARIFRSEMDQLRHPSYAATDEADQADRAAQSDLVHEAVERADERVAQADAEVARLRAELIRHRHDPRAR